MSLTSLQGYIDRDNRRRERIAAGSVMARYVPVPAYDPRVREWGDRFRRLTFFAKQPGATIPDGSAVIAVRLNQHNQYVPVLIEAFEGDCAGFASFPRLALMLGATELQIGLMDGTMRDRAAAVRELTEARHGMNAPAWFDRAALLSRPLAVAGHFDRSAIMATACAVAKARQGLTGEAWGVCLSAALRGVWTLARAARLAAAH